MDATQWRNALRLLRPTGCAHAGYLLWLLVRYIAGRQRTNMDRVRDILLYFVAALAMFSLLCAVYQAMQGQIGSATVLGGLFVACTMIVYIPQLELLKVFGVEARLREVKDTLTEAQVIINRLNRLSAVNTRVSYMLMGWGNRMDGPTAKDKQSILDDVDRQLVEIHMLSPQERGAITKPYVQLIGLTCISSSSRSWNAIRHSNRTRLCAFTPPIRAMRTGKS